MTITNHTNIVIINSDFIKMTTTSYFIICNKEENCRFGWILHNEFHYCDGINVLPKTNLDLKEGFYFIDSKNIFNDLDSLHGIGFYLRSVTLPTSDEDFKMVPRFDNRAWYANKIILGERMELSKVETIEYLVNNGVDIHYKNDYLLVWASEQGYTDIVRYLILHGADFRTDHHSALCLAAKNGHLGVVKLLVEFGADINNNKEIYQGNHSILSLACENGHLNLVTYLVSVGADIHANNNYPLIAAAKGGHLDIIKYLVSIGANINNYFVHNGFYKYNITAIGEASDNNKLNVVKYLLENGVDVQVCDNVAVINASNRGHLDLVKYLIEKGADVKTTNIALIKAIDNSHFDVAKYLVLVGAPIQTNQSDALKVAAQTGNLDMVKYLCESNPNLDINRALDCALFISRYGSDDDDHDVLKYLISKESEKKPTYTIQFASKQDYLRVINQMINNDAKIHVDNVDDKHVVQWSF